MADISKIQIESGTYNIKDAYLREKSITSFNTINDLKSATKLQAGNVVSTLGFHSINDNGGSEYYIKELENETVDNIHIHQITNTNLIAILNKSEKINVKELGAYGDDTHDDSDVISYAVNNFNEVYFPYGTYIFNNRVEYPLCNIMCGDNSEIKKSNNTDNNYMFIFNNNPVIKNLKFNSNNIGRGNVSIENCDNCLVDNCEFTGYSNDYGYYQTDSCLLITNVVNPVVSNCNFHDSGYNLENSVGNLNRGLTIQNSNYAKVINCSFLRLMQALCTLNDNTFVANCNFDYIKDNDLYHLSYDNSQEGNLTLCNSYISNRYDEGIVIRGKKIIIKGNIIENIPTAINMAGNCEDIIIDSNTFYNIGNSVQTGNVFSSRDASYTANNLVITNNTINLPVITPSTGQYMFIPAIGNLNISGNNIKYKAQTSGRGIYINNVNYFKFCENTIIDENNVSVSNAVQLANPAISSVVNNNITGVLRISLTNTNYNNLPFITTNAGPYIRTDGNKKIFVGGAIPATGTWDRGDIIINFSPSAGGSFGWVCVTAGTPGTWKSISTISS